MIIDRIEKEFKKNISPFLVLSIIKNQPNLKQSQIIKAVTEKTEGLYIVNEVSMKYLLNQMAGQFGLIEKEDDTYVISDKGLDLYTDVQSLLKPIKKFIE